MRIRLLAIALLTVAACGGGSDSPTLGSAALQGVVYELDGQTLDRSGVRVSVVETGATAVTGADGRFSFSSLPVGVITLDFGSGVARIAHQEGGDDASQAEDQADDSGNDDGDDDGSDDDGSDDDGDDDGDEDDDDDDDDGHPRVAGIETGDVVSVRCSVKDGKLVEFSVSGSDRLRAESSLFGADATPFPGAEGEIEIESRADRDKIEIDAEPLPAGTVVEFFLDDPDDSLGFVSIGTAAALADGVAELERATNDGATLPFGAGSVGDLSGFLVEVRLASTGELMLTGVVPDLPTGIGGLDDNETSGRARGLDHLTPLVAGVEGGIEIRRRPDGQLFKMEAENLSPGTVTFEIEDPDNPDTFLELATRTADAEGEAEISTSDGLPLPLGVDDVSELVGLDVRVTRGGETILTGTVPPLVAD